MIVYHMTETFIKNNCKLMISDVFFFHKNEKENIHNTTKTS